MKLVHFIVAVLSLSFVAATAVRADTACTPYEQQQQIHKDDRIKLIAQKKMFDIQAQKCGNKLSNPLANPPTDCDKAIYYAKELGHLLAATDDHDRHFVEVIASCQRNLQANCNKMRDYYYTLKHRRNTTTASGVATSILSGGTSAASAAVTIAAYEAAMHKVQNYMRGIGCSNTP